MIELGCHLSAEEFGARPLVEMARIAEDSGFSFATISDHFHPWTHRQGQAPFVWAVIGAIAQNTKTLRLGTAVTCPLIRIHPAIIAQAAATAQDLMEGRFFLGLGTGEKLNEHVTGQSWPEPEVRWNMLEEAIQIMRLLWKGGEQNFSGTHYKVVDAQLFSLPSKLPEIFVAANVEASAELAGRCADGLIAVAPKKELVSTFESSGGKGKSRIGNVTVCYGKTKEEAQRIAFETWPTSGIKESKLHWDLPTPTAFEEEIAREKVTVDDIAKKVICGPDPAEHIQAIQKFVDAGFTHVGVKQCGPQQKEFFKFYQEQVLPQLTKLKVLVAH